MSEGLGSSDIQRAVMDFWKGRKDYVLFGAMAVNAHVPMKRATQDVDIIMHANNAEQAAKDLCGYLNQTLHIAARLRKLKRFESYRVYRRIKGKEPNEHHCDITTAESLPDWQSVDGWQVIVPFELLRMKLESAYSRSAKAKGFTDRADIVRLLEAYPYLRTNQDLVPSLSSDAVVETWKEMLQVAELPPDDDDEGEEIEIHETR